MPWKGLALALRALALVPAWRLVVLGSGPDLPRLRRLARRYAVEDRVEFRAWQPREEVLRCMREESNVLLFPSLHDEAGWVMVEALAVGLPVVCLDHGGPPVVARAIGAGEDPDGRWSGMVSALQRVSGLRAVAFLATGGSGALAPRDRLSSFVLEAVER